MSRGCTRAAVHDVHATKVVAAVPDAETGEVQYFPVGGEVGEAAGLCAALPRRLFSRVIRSLVARD